LTFLLNLEVGKKKLHLRDLKIIRMKFPLWKRIASYFTDIYIERSTSEVNEELYVILSKGRLQLCTANVIYSYEDLYKNFSLLFSEINYSFLKNKKVLILGFGLGSIPILLEQNTQESLNFIGIEIDEEVIYLANKYILSKIKGPVQLICADAEVFVQTTSERFDMILIDVFIDNVIPAELLSFDFLSKVKDLLYNDRSLVVMNTLANGTKSTAESHKFFSDTFKACFPSGAALALHKNLMLVSNSKNLLNK